MTVRRLEHVGIVVDDLPAATEFFLALGLESEGEMSVEGDFVDRINGLEGVQAEIVMLRAPAGGAKLELARYVSPSPAADATAAPPNAPGLRHVLFVVDDIEESLTAPKSTAASWSASSSTTRTATGSVTCAARRESSSSWPRRSADRAPRELVADELEPAPIADFVSRPPAVSLVESTSPGVGNRSEQPCTDEATSPHLPYRLEE